MASREKQLLDSVQSELHALATEAKKKYPALKAVCTFFDVDFSNVTGVALCVVVPWLSGCAMTSYRFQQTY
jgi:hypothetical protein